MDWYSHEFSDKTRNLLDQALYAKNIYRVCTREFNGQMCTDIFHNPSMESKVQLSFPDGCIFWVKAFTTHEKRYVMKFPGEKEKERVLSLVFPAESHPSVPTTEKDSDTYAQVFERIKEGIDQDIERDPRRVDLWLQTIQNYMIVQGKGGQRPQLTSTDEIEKGYAFIVNRISEKEPAKVAAMFS